MVEFLRRRHKTCRTILVEKTDRLCRNLRDYVTLDELNLEIHFVKESFVEGLRPVVDAERGGKEATTESATIELHLRWREANSQLRKTLLLASRRVLAYGMAGLTGLEPATSTLTGWHSETD